MLQSGQRAVCGRNPGGLRARRCGAATGRRSWSTPTRPIRSPPADALGTLAQLVNTALLNERAAYPTARAAAAFEIVAHARYNPAGSSQLNIVPGLLGTILTLTMLIFTALSVTREIERGTMENLLSMPIAPLEIMLGKITPYVVIGFFQATMIVVAAVVLFHVPIVGASDAARRAFDAVHRHQPVGRLHLLDAGAEPASGGADGDDVLFAQHAAVGLSVSVRRHAAMGAICRRDAAAHALSCASCAPSCSRAQLSPTSITTRWCSRR